MPAQELSSLNRKTGPEPVRLRSLRVLRRLRPGTGGILLRGAGDRMLLVGHHGLDQLHGPAQAQIAGIDAEVVAVHTAHFLEE